MAACESHGLMPWKTTSPHELMWNLSGETDDERLVGARVGHGRCAVCVWGLQCGCEGRGRARGSSFEEKLEELR